MKPAGCAARRCRRQHPAATDSAPSVASQVVADQADGDEAWTSGRMERGHLAAWSVDIWPHGAWTSGRMERGHLAAWSVDIWPLIVKGRWRRAGYEDLDGGRGRDRVGDVADPQRGLDQGADYL